MRTSLEEQAVNRSLSVYLNLLRGLAALAVVLSHVDYRGIGGHAFRWFRISDLGHQAVMVFFVLSGYVIAASAERTATLYDYWTARLARMYSVVVPVVLLAPALYLIGHAADPGVYEATPGIHATPPALAALHTLLFTSEFGLGSHRYFGTVPLWSLSYEVAYYALFGLSIYLGGARRIASVGLLALLVGPKILLLMPVWLLGVLVYRWRDRFPAGATALGASLVLYAVYALLHAEADAAILHLFRSLGINPDTVLGWSKDFVTDYVLGLIVALNLAGAQNLFLDALRWPEMLASASTWLADRSFSLYVFHMPFLYLGAALLGSFRHGFVGGSLMLAGAVAACFALAPLTDLRKREWLGLIRMLPRRRQAA